MAKKFVLVSLPLNFIEKYTISVNSNNDIYWLLETDAVW
jgi:hypothetical protein